jgi:hypothetical protein
LKQFYRKAGNHYGGGFGLIFGKAAMCGTGSIKERIQPVPPKEVKLSSANEQGDSTIWGLQKRMRL